MSSKEAPKKPLEVRKACLVLGFSASDLSPQTVLEALDKQMAAALSDERAGMERTERSLEIKAASDTLLVWLAEQGPGGPNPKPTNAATAFIRKPNKK